MKKENKIRIVSIIILVFTLLLAVGFTVYTVGATDPWYNSGWKYRKSITITGNIIGCQIKIIVGNNSGGNITCNGHLGKNDFGDIRFINVGLNLLPYWCENYTTDIQATFWINNTYNNSLIYMYYGNTGVSSIQNGNTTFWLFDDFNGTSLNTHKWSITGSPTITVTGSEITVYSNTANYYVKSIKSFGLNYELYIKLKDVNTFAACNIGFELTPSPPYNNPSYLNIAPASNTVRRPYWADGVNPYQYGTIFNNCNVYYFLKLCRFSNRVMCYKNNTDIANSVTNIPTDFKYIEFGVGGTLQGNQKIIIAYIFVKKFWNIEQYFSSFGTEENFPNNSPIINSYTPLDNSICISIPILYVNISDIESDIMNISFYSNYSGSFNIYYTYHNITDGIYNYTFSSLILNSTIFWGVIVNDSVNTVNETYNFYLVNCSNSCNGSFDPNITGDWLYIGATLVFDNSQLFLLISLSLWLIFLFKYLDVKDKGLLYVQFGLSIPLTILIGATSFIMSASFGYIFCFVIPIISVYYLIDFFNNDK